MGRLLRSASASTLRFRMRRRVAPAAGANVQKEAEILEKWERAANFRSRFQKARPDFLEVGRRRDLGRFFAAESSPKAEIHPPEAASSLPKRTTASSLLRPPLFKNLRRLLRISTGFEPASPTLPKSTQCGTHSRRHSAGTGVRSHHASLCVVSHRTLWTLRRTPVSRS